MDSIRGCSVAMLAVLFLLPFTETPSAWAAKALEGSFLPVSQQANGATVSAVGLLLFRRYQVDDNNKQVPVSPDATFDGGCTAALVSPETILTAAHCLLECVPNGKTDGLGNPLCEYQFSRDIVFIPGLNRSVDERAVKEEGVTIVNSQIPALYYAKPNKLSPADIAVAKLSRPITDLKPLRVEPMGDSTDLEKNRSHYLSYGYPVTDGIVGHLNRFLGTPTTIASGFIHFDRIPIEGASGSPVLRWAADGRHPAVVGVLTGWADGEGLGVPITADVMQLLNLK